MNLQEERKAWKKGYKFVVGIDEAGRGSGAGPVIAAAVLVVLNIKTKEPEFKEVFKYLLDSVNDSKKLTSLKREKLYKKLILCPYIFWGVGRVGERIIDRINIKNAAELAMEKALKGVEKKIKRRVDFLIIDGNNLKNSELKTYKFKLMVKADQKVFSCAAASIIAKVIRDGIMKKEAIIYPQYGFERNKGYLTGEHFYKLKKYGPCKIHRRSFFPIKGNF